MLSTFEVDEKDPERFIQVVKAIAPTFGGINLEDIKAPECFEIETRLKEELRHPRDARRPTWHRHHLLRSLLNACEVAGKRIEDVKLVMNGAGAAAISCARLYISFGLNPSNLIMLDSKGVISADRTDINAQKREFATERTDVRTLAEAVQGADVFVGLSKGNVLSQDMVRTWQSVPSSLLLPIQCPKFLMRRLAKHVPMSSCPLGAPTIPTKSITSWDSPTFSVVRSTLLPLPSTNL